MRFKDLVFCRVCACVCAANNTINQIHNRLSRSYQCEKRAHQLTEEKEKRAEDGRELNKHLNAKSIPIILNKRPLLYSLAKRNFLSG